ncbi:hypothetical protein CHU98_g12478 [Xylaria longipes]|nr:hypothetical protein CHU98_g12478 [Xylaria longipes]
MPTVPTDIVIVSTYSKAETASDSHYLLTQLHFGCMHLDDHFSYFLNLDNMKATTTTSQPANMYSNVSHLRHPGARHSPQATRQQGNRATGTSGPFFRDLPRRDSSYNVQTSPLLDERRSRGIAERLLLPLGRRKQLSVDPHDEGKRIRDDEEGRHAGRCEPAPFETAGPVAICDGPVVDRIDHTEYRHDRLSSKKHKSPLADHHFT